VCDRPCAWQSPDEDGDDLGQELAYLLAAILILVIGAWLAQVLGKVAQAAVASMGVEFHEGIGQVMQGLLLVDTAVLAVEQLGLNLTFLTDALTNLLTIVAAGLALAFGLGDRDVTRNVLAGYYARDQFAPGDGLVVDGEVGTRGYWDRTRKHESVRISVPS
jgi:hypothetical protein